MKIRHFGSLLTGALLLGLVSCEYKTIEPYDVVIPPTPVDFATEIEPIFTQAGCTMCHTASHVLNLSTGKAYTALVARNCVDTANPANSKLLVKINSGHNSGSVTDVQKALILKWIEEGAKGVIVKVKYSTQVEPMWQSAKYNCVICHGGSTSPDLRTGKSYTALTGGGFVIANNPTGSKLMKKINEKHNGAANMTQEEKDLVSTWIAQGAENN